MDKDTEKDLSQTYLIIFVLGLFIVLGLILK